MLKQKELLIIASLRRNSRQSLTQISKAIHIPISTIFDTLRMHEKTLIRKHTSLIDFSKLGYNTRAAIAIKTENKHKESLKSFLVKHPNVNSLYKTSNDHDFLIEAIFRNIKDMDDFIEKIANGFEIIKKETYYIVDDIKREEFFSDPNHSNFIHEK